MKSMIYKLALMYLVMASALLSKCANAQTKVIVPFAQHGQCHLSRRHLLYRACASEQIRVA